MKTLYIHIGTPKTGTTALQVFCWQNMKALENNGYCFPDMQEIRPEWPKTRNGHFLVYGSENKKERALASVTWEKYRMGMDIVVKKFEEYDNIILSEELIFSATDGAGKELWKELKADSEKYGFEIKIVVYLRRQDEFVTSLWQQSIKRRTEDTNMSVSSRSWDDFVDTAKNWKRLNYYEKLESIAADLGRENIIVRRYDRKRFLENSIYVDFLDAIGLEMTEDFVITTEERNPSLYGNACEIMRVLNGIGDIEEDDRDFMRRLLLIDGEISKVEYPCSMFSKEECKEFMDLFKESNRRVAKEYLGEEDTDFFYDTVSDLPKWTADNPYMYQDIIRVMALGFKQLREDNEKLQQDDSNKLSRTFHLLGSRLVKKSRG